MPEAILGPLPPTAVVALTTRSKIRDQLRKSFSRKVAQLTLVATPDDLVRAMRASVVDAVILDLGYGAGSNLGAAKMARDYPSVPFFALVGLRPSDLPTVSKYCSEMEFAEYLVEGLDEQVHRQVVLPKTFTARFAMALLPAAAHIGLETPLQRTVWTTIVRHGGRVVKTESLAKEVKMTREHLSRQFSAAGGPNLKRLIDLTRLLAAAELAKNPGYDLADTAAILDFSSLSHLGVSSQRVLGVKATSLVRLRPEDLIGRFVRQRQRQGQGQGRSRTLRTRGS